MRNTSIRTEHDIDNIPRNVAWTFQQYDDGIVRLALMHDRTGLECEGQTFSLFVKKPDGILVEMSDQDRFKATGNEIDIHMTTNMVDIAGRLICELQISDDGGTMTTAPFTITIRPIIGKGDTVISENYLGSIERLIVETEDKVSMFEERMNDSLATLGEYADAETERINNEEKRKQALLDLQALHQDVQNKLDNGEFIGEQGIQGPKGEQGIQGIQGPKGDTGEQGIQGLKGDKGEKGDKGDTGAKGDKGDTGAQGIQGEQGVKGDKGDKGDTVDSMPEVADARVDYLGHRHETLKEAMDSNVEKTKDIIDERLGWMTHEGTNITANHSLEGECKNAVVSGKTLVNLAIKELSNVTVLEDGYIEPNKITYDYLSTDISMFKPSTDYYVIAEIVEHTADCDIRMFTVMNSSVWSTGMRVPPNTTGVFKSKIRTKDVFSPDVLYGVWIGGMLLDTGHFKLRYMLLEYEEGMENWDIPYFEGMKSVTNPSVKITGKNLLNIQAPLAINRPNVTPTNITSNSITITSVKDSSGAAYCDFNMQIKFKKDVKYRLSYEYTSVNEGGNAFRVYDSKTNKTVWNTNSTNNSCMFDEDFIGNVSLYAFNNANSKAGMAVEYRNIQLEEGSVVTSYEPYIETIIEPTEPLELLGEDSTLDLVTGEVVKGHEKFTLNVTDVRYDGVNKSGLDRFRVSTAERPIDIMDMTEHIICTTNGFIGSNNFNYGSHRGISYNMVAGKFFITLEKGYMSESELLEELLNNPMIIVYSKLTPTTKTVELTNKPVSYKDVTHFTCSSDILTPKLKIDVSTDLQAVISEQVTTINTLSIENQQLKSSNEQLQQETTMLNDMDNMTMMAIDEANADLVGIDDMTMLAIDDVYAYIESLENRIATLEGGE